MGPASPAPPMDEQGTPQLRYLGGRGGALLPFALFLAGVATLGLSGAPDERGFWPVLLGALTLGLLLSRDRRAWADAFIAGTARPIVMIMVMAWMLAGVLASLMSASGFVPGLVWVARAAGVHGSGFTVASFLICCAVSTATGTSLGTLIVCLPLLYPAGVTLGADPAFLVGALLGGATFGDNISPVSDTTIASATTQDADIGGVVRSRMRYALPAAAVSILGFAVLGGGRGGEVASVPLPGGDPGGLPMLLAPALVLGLLLARRHLLEGLLLGNAAAVVLAVGLGRIAPADLIHVEAGAFVARGLILDGMERGLGISVFTILLLGLVETLAATGLVEDLLSVARRRARTAAGIEAWIFLAVSAAVMLTTHAVVAILTVGRFAREAGEASGVHRYRRANLLDVTVCTWPFLLPWFIPTILAASLTADTAAELGATHLRLGALTAGLHNLHSWALLAVVVLAVFAGYGRGGDRDAAPGRS